VVNHDYKAGSISGVIISVMASSVVNLDYKAGSISDVILEASTLIITPLILFSLVIMIYHTRSQHTNNYTTDISCLVY
jgi:Na+/H+-dicarboxylate symporter